jgi:hypothetical protein
MRLPMTTTSTKPAQSTKLTKLAFNLSTGADTGGAAIREVEAFRSPAGRALNLGWEVNAMVAASNYIEYPEDVPHSLAALERLYAAADVVHLNHTLHGHLWYDKGRQKPTVLEHHGLHKGSFDIDFPGAIAQAAGMGCVQIGSTVNLELFGPITWAPIPYDLAALAALKASAPRVEPVPARNARNAHTRNDDFPLLLDPPGLDPRATDVQLITIAHAPTNREIKSTAAFIAAIKLLQEIGLPVRGLLIENRPHSECLRLKAAADIFVDQLVLGYGCNAIEAWGMGIPVVGGVSNPKWRSHMVARWEGMPLFEATEATLAKRLTTLVISRSLREEYIEQGRVHVERFHSQAGHVKLMSGIYESAKPTRPLEQTKVDHLTHAERLAILRANRAAMHARRIVG